MLRVTFHSANERAFDNVISALAAVSRSTASSQAFTVYNVTSLRAGANAAVGVEMVEIHNDEDVVFSSALDQVIHSIQCPSPLIDSELRDLARKAGFRHSPRRYCMLQGKLFSAVPAALGYVVRHACPGKQTGKAPAVIRLDASSKSITAVLDYLNQLCDFGLKSPGVVGCLVQGIAAFADQANLLFIFASDMELLAFAQDQQVKLLATAAKAMASKLSMTLYGEASGFAQRAVQDLKTALSA